MSTISAIGELDAWDKLLTIIVKNGERVGNYLEVSNLLVEIPFSQNNWQEFVSFRKKYLELGGITAELGWNRATRVYTEQVDRPTKPSYLNRLRAFPDRTRRMKEYAKLDQISKISELLAKKPGFSNLSFVFLRPADLHDQFRPGYVPCPIAGDFKFRSGKLGLSVMFRTNDAYAVGYADIYYLRKLQIEVLNNSQQLTESLRLKNGALGNLNLFFSRTYIEKTKALKKPAKGRVRVIPLVDAIVEAIRAQQVSAPDAKSRSI